MFILPYFHAIRKSAEKPIHMVYLFLGNGGTSLLEIESSPEVFCDENDLPISEIMQKDGIVFVKVDMTTLDHSAFYTFHETRPEGVEVWKTFLWVGDTEDSDPWNTNEYFKSLHLHNKSVYTLLKTILDDGLRD